MNVAIWSIEPKVSPGDQRRDDGWLTSALQIDMNALVLGEKTLKGKATCGDLETARWRSGSAGRTCSSSALTRPAFSPHLRRNLLQVRVRCARAGDGGRVETMEQLRQVLVA